MQKVGVINEYPEDSMARHPFALQSNKLLEEHSRVADGLATYI